MYETGNNFTVIENGNAVIKIENTFEMNGNEMNGNENTSITIDNETSVQEFHEMTGPATEESECIEEPSKAQDTSITYALVKLQHEEHGEEQARPECLTLENAPEMFLFKMNEKGEITKINEQALAILFQRTHKVVFIQGKGMNNFYVYSQQTGLWTVVTDIEMENMISAFGNEYFANLGLPGACFALTHNRITNTLKILKSRAIANGFFEKPEVDDHVKFFIHCKNGVVEISENGDLVLMPFSPKYRSRSRFELEYNPESKTPKRFLNTLIYPSMSKVDAKIVQLYMGQCLLGRNLSQRLLILTGEGGSGKSSIINLLQSIFREKYSELRLSHAGGRFEIGQYKGKDLLVGPDVPSDFLYGKNNNLIKRLTGDDALKGEFKNSNETCTIKGHFNLIISSNFKMKVLLDHDETAWTRRVIWIKCEGVPQKFTYEISDVLLEKEGNEIFKWMLLGAQKLLKDGGQIRLDKEQQERAASLLEEDNPVKSFLQDHVELDKESTLTNTEIWNQYNSVRNQEMLPAVKMHDFIHSMCDAMSELFHCNLRKDIHKEPNKTQRGFCGVRFKKPVIMNPAEA